MANTTPEERADEERAATLYTSVLFETTTNGAAVALISKVIRDAEAVARAKAFKEAEAMLAEEISRQEKILTEANAMMQKACPDARALSESPLPSSFQRVKDVLDRLCIKLSARAKEAAHG